MVQTCLNFFFPVYSSGRFDMDTIVGSNSFFLAVIPFAYKL